MLSAPLVRLDVLRMVAVMVEQGVDTVDAQVLLLVLVYQTSVPLVDLMGT